MLPIRAPLRTRSFAGHGHSLQRHEARRSVRRDAVGGHHRLSRLPALQHVDRRRAGGEEGRRRRGVRRRPQDADRQDGPRLRPLPAAGARPRDRAHLRRQRGRAFDLDDPPGRREPQHAHDRRHAEAGPDPRRADEAGAEADVLRHQLHALHPRSRAASEGAGMTATTMAAPRAATTTRVASGCLLAAAAVFAAAWYLVPVAGITDTREIFRVVSDARGEMLAAAILQLLAAVLYVPAMVGIIREGGAAFWRPAAIVIVGTLGLATDAIDHILAYAMTAPGVDQEAQVETMQFMQGPALMLIAPLIAAFFVGAGWLSVAYAKAGAISNWNPRLYLIALVVGGVGAVVAAATDIVDARTVGLIAL